MKEIGHSMAKKTAEMVITVLNVCVGADHRVLQRVKKELVPP
jgi:hypothetical protein